MLRPSHRALALPLPLPLPVLVALLAACSAAPRRAPADLPLVAADVAPLVERQLREHGIPGAAIAVVDVRAGGEWRWHQGFGAWRPVDASGAPVTGAQVEAWRRDAPSEGPDASMPFDAVFRMASISKLFTATAAMVLVERGRLDLDAPVQRYLPELGPRNPFGGEVTLRQLLGHRAGVVRESPVGHYFDPSEPTLAATVASLNDTALVHEPGSVFKYSNPGLAVVGEVVARVTGKPFEDAVRELVLAPLGLSDSDFAPRADLLARQAHGVMWTYDGREIPCPDFAFGYAPAANLRSTCGDLATFARSWLPSATQRVLSPAAQAAMWALPDGATKGCGIGFFVDALDGHRMVGHGGAVYGFASAVHALPEHGLAVAVVVTKDFGNAVADAIAERALRAALAARAGERLPPPVHPVPVGRERARQLAGHYRVGRDWVELHERGGELWYVPNVGVCTRLRLAGDGAFVSDDVLSLGSRRLTTLPNGNLHDGVEEYVRDDAMPPPCPAELHELLGEYGWDHDVLIVYEDRGELAVLIEWVVRDIVQRTGPDEYVFPPGMYGGDPLRFERDANGKVIAAVVGGARFERRPDPAPGGFRITPRAPIAELQAAAATAKPPQNPDAAAWVLRDMPPIRAGQHRAAELVELAALEPGLTFDLVYASPNNFLGTPVYPPHAMAKLQRPAAEALVRVHQALAAQGFGLHVFDAYRPWSVTKVFWDATPDELRHFVADPNQGSRHNRGCAVDLTLHDLATGEPVEMPSGFDEFTPRAYPDYPGGTSRQRHCREVLRRAMEAACFTVYEHEWWHFDFAGWQAHPIGNEPL
jgi:D-alanyl-D-alanine dipeptidase/CubicO group peptidase (beta-lactamase class C family)